MTLAGTKIRQGPWQALASNEELQRDLGQIPETKPMDKNMQMDHMNMDHG